MQWVPARTRLLEAAHGGDLLLEAPPAPPAMHDSIRAPGHSVVRDAVRNTVPCCAVLPADAVQSTRNHLCVHTLGLAFSLGPLWYLHVIGWVHVTGTCSAQFSAQAEGASR